MHKNKDTFSLNILNAIFGHIALADESKHARRMIIKVLNTIESREAIVLVLRLACDMTLQGCGEIMGITKERVRQIEAKGLSKLRHPSRSKLSIPFILEHKEGRDGKENLSDSTCSGK